MQALDLRLDGQRADRLTVVKSVVSKFIAARPNDRIGIIAFAGQPFLVSPLTLDHDWLEKSLSRVTIGTGEDGTAIGSALAASVNRLRHSDAKSKIVVLLTDGMNNAGQRATRAGGQGGRGAGDQGLHHRGRRRGARAHPGRRRRRPQAHRHGRGRGRRADAARNRRRHRRRLLSRHRHRVPGGHLCAHRQPGEDGAHA